MPTGSCSRTRSAPPWPRPRRRSARFDALFDTFFARDEFGAASRRRRRAARPGRGAAGRRRRARPRPDAAGATTPRAWPRPWRPPPSGAGVADIRLSTQRSLLTRRMLDEMGLRELERIIADAARRAPRTRSLADRLRRARARRCSTRPRRYVERQHELYAAESGRRLREDLLAEGAEADGGIDAGGPGHDAGAGAADGQAPGRPLFAPPAHRAKRGQLDVRRTLRKSMGHGGVPFDIVWKTKKIDKPKIVAICDVSSSVAAAAQFLLLFLYSLNEVVERLDAFAFSDRLISGRRHPGRQRRRGRDPRGAEAHRLPADRLRPALEDFCEHAPGPARPPHHGDHPGRRPLQLCRSPPRPDARRSSSARGR